MDRDAKPAGHDQGPMLLATAFSLYGLAVVIYAIRIWSRLTPKFALTAADYMISIALASMTICLGFATAAVSHGFGKHSADIDPDDFPYISSYLLGVFMAGVPASCFARISIACLLLRFTTGRWWRILLWSTIVLQAVTVLMYETVQLAKCKSVFSHKSLMRDSECLTPAQVWGFTYGSVSIAMVSDLICAIIPVFLIWSLTRSVVEKILISILMGSCLLATGCGVAKIYYMVTFEFTDDDGFYLMIPEFFWCRMEQAFIIIAACAPLIKRPIERGLHRLGLPTFKVPQRELNVVSSGPQDASKDDGPWLERYGSESTEHDLERGAMTTTTSNGT